MAKRDLTLKLGIVAIPALLLFAAFAFWSSVRGPGGLDVPDGEDGSPRAGAGTAGEGAARKPSPADPSRSAAGDTSSEPREGEPSIGGTVLDPSGEPSGGAEVFLLALDADGDPALAAAALPEGPRSLADSRRLARDLEKRLAASPRTSASADGRFAFSGSDPGLFRLITRAAGRLPAVSDAISIDGERYSGPVELRLKRAASIRGVVSNPEGSPVAGARIEAAWSAEPREALDAGRRRGEDILEAALALRAATARCDGSGLFEVTGILGGYYDLVVTAGGYGRCEVAGAPTGDAVLRIVLGPELFLRGEVFDTSEKPIAGAEVRMIRLAADTSDLITLVQNIRAPPAPGSAPGARTGDDGRFAIGGLASGAYRVEAERSGYQRAIAPIVVVHEAISTEERPLVFRLKQGLEIRGVVRSAGGDPLAGAAVRVLLSRPISTGGPASADGPGGDSRDQSFEALIYELVGRDPQDRSTRAGGTFEFRELRAGLYRLEVLAGSHRSRAIDDVAAGGEPLDITLAAAVTVQGIVADDRSKEPIAGASVSHRPAAKEASYAAGSGEEARPPRTDREGRFRIDDLPEGLHIIRVEAEGYQTLETPPVDGGGDGELMIALARGGSVSGRVHAAPGSPLEGLRVSLRKRVEPDFDEDWRRAGRTASTGADGTYRLLIPEGGSYRVVVEGRPYVTAASRIIEVPDAQAAVDGIDIELRLAAAVRGRVIDPSGLPVGGAQVQVLPAPGAGMAEGAAADPIEEGMPETFGGGGTARADATGAFEVAGLRPGRFRVVADAPGYIRAKLESFEIAAGGASEIEIQMEPEMAIAGTVVSGEGEPIPMAEIRAGLKGEGGRGPWSEERAFSSTPGTFRLGKLAGGRYDLWASAHGFASAVIEDIPAGRRDVEIRLERPLSLAGKVLGAFTEEPVPEYRLRLEFEAEDRLSSEERRSIGRWLEVRDPGGAFSIDGLPPGRYLVEIDAPGHLDAGAIALELPLREGLADVTIPIPESGIIGGVIFDGQARPLAGARVQALKREEDAATGRITYRTYTPPPGAAASGRPEGGEEVPRRGEGGGGRNGPGLPDRATTQGDGRFWLRGLPDGVYRLRISHDDFVSGESGDVRLQDGSGGDAAVGVVVYLDPGATLLGSVRWLSDVEGRALTVSLVPAGRGAGAARNSAPKSARVDPTGRFEIRGLAVGEYILSAIFRRSSDGSFASVRRTVQIKDPVREMGITLQLSR